MVLPELTLLAFSKEKVMGFLCEVQRNIEG
jgi:hypothetical protein